jgi:tetratricopeptide (TPR) repeat protein
VQAKLIDLLTKARAALQSQNFAEAESLTNKALKLDAKSPDAHMTMGILKASTGKLEEAIKHFRAVLKEQPQLSQVRANLATALYELEEYEEAITEFDKALRADPNLIKARLTYASALRKAEHYDKAEKEYKQILSRYPQSHEALNGIALTYMNQDKEDESLNAFHHATQLASVTPEYLLNFAIALDQFNYPNFALQKYEEALKLKPDWVEARKHLIDNLLKSKNLDQSEKQIMETLKKYPKEPEVISQLGLLYHELHRNDKANSCYDEALMIDRNNIKAKICKARLLAERGDFETAVSAYEDLIVKHPNFAMSYGLYSKIKKFTPEDSFLGKIEEIIEKNRHLLSTEAVNFALGKIYDDCRDWDKAFFHYQEGNTLANRYKRYSSDEDKKIFEESIKYFSQDRLHKLNKFNVGQKLPILIVGMPRSGTTLVEDIISRHSKVADAGEVEFWRGEIDQVLGIELKFPQNITQLRNDTAEELVKNYIDKLKGHIHSEKNYEFITDKLPHNFLWLGLIAGLFDEMPIIHCKRDPMDNCLSIYFQHFEGEHSYAYDLKNIGLHYKYYEQLMAHWHNVLPGRILDVNYEDVVADPEYWTRRMIEHVGLPWEEGCLEQQDSSRAIKTASIWQVRQPIYRSSVQRWKHYEKYLGPLKEGLGYEETKKAS